MIHKFNFLHFLTATCLIEVFMLYLFRFTSSPFSGKAINNWYTNLKWSAVILDILSVLIGFYLAKFLYEYLIKQNIISKEYEIIKFLGLVLLIQIAHDFSFYALIVKNAKKGTNKVIDEFIDYAKSVGIGAVIGDSFMYLLATPALFMISRLSNDVNSFISICCLYLIGYFVYQKPKILI
jgi:hypothetical protein